MCCFDAVAIKQFEGEYTDDICVHLPDTTQYQQRCGPFADHLVRYGRTPKPIGMFRQKTIQVGYASTVECADPITGHHQ